MVTLCVTAFQYQRKKILSDYQKRNERYNWGRDNMEGKIMAREIIRLIHTPHGIIEDYDGMEEDYDGELEEEEG